MSDQSLRLLVGGALFLHGIGHGGAVAALAWIARFPAGDTGGWRAASSWLMPSLTPSTATTVACLLWTLSLVGFVGAATGFLGIVPFAAWRVVAVVSAVVSGAGIVLFLGTWPMFNTLAALAMNLAVIVAVLDLGWPRG